MYVTLPSEFHRIPVNASNVHGPAGAPGVRSVRSVKAGACLFHEGDEARSLYEVITGVLRLTRVLENGRRQVIAFGYPGDIVGFPNDGRHHTECDAITEVSVVALRRDALEKPAGDPDLHQRLMSAALHEISAMQDHFMMLGRKSAAEKLMSFLNVLAERVGTPMGNYTRVDLPMNRSDIADFLGLTTETVSRTFTKLRNQNIIALQDVHTVIVLNPGALGELDEAA